MLHEPKLKNTLAIRNICVKLNWLTPSKLQFLIPMPSAKSTLLYSLRVNNHLDRFFMHFLIMTAKVILLLCLLENSSVQISPTGTLILRHFKSHLSGVYNCSLHYKLTATQPDKKLLLKYVIYGKLSTSVSVLLCSKRFYFKMCVAIY